MVRELFKDELDEFPEDDVSRIDKAAKAFLQKYYPNLLEYESLDARQSNLKFEELTPAQQFSAILLVLALPNYVGRSKAW